MQEFRREGSPDDELAAAVVRINALLAESKEIDAQNEYEYAQTLARKSQNPYARLQCALTRVQVKLNSARPNESTPLPVQIDKEAGRRGYKGIQLENRLFQAEIANDLGRHSEAQEQLAAVETGARAEGYGLISRPAMAVRRSSQMPSHP